MRRRDGLLCLKLKTPRELPQSGGNQEMAKAWLLSAKLGFIQVLQINLLKPWVKQSLSRGSHQGGSYWSPFSLAWPVCLEPQRRTPSFVRLSAVSPTRQQESRGRGVALCTRVPQLGNRRPGRGHCFAHPESKWKRVWVHSNRSREINRSSVSLLKTNSVWTKEGSGKGDWACRSRTGLWQIWNPEECRVEVVAYL